MPANFTPEQQMLFDGLHESLFRLKKEWDRTLDPVFVQRYHAVYDHLVSLGWDGKITDYRVNLPFDLRPPKKEKLTRLLRLEARIAKEVAAYSEKYGEINFRAEKYIYLRRNGVSRTGIDMDSLVSNFAASSEVKLEEPYPVDEAKLIEVLECALITAIESWRRLLDPRYIEHYHAAYYQLLALGAGSIDIEMLLPSTLMPPNTERLNQLKKLEEEISEELRVLGEACNKVWWFNISLYIKLRRMGATKEGIDLDKLRL